MKIRVTGIKTVRWSTVVEVETETDENGDYPDPYEIARQLVYSGKAKLEFDPNTENVLVETYRVLERHGYIDPDTGFVSEKPPSPEAHSVVKFMMAPHMELYGREKEIIKAYERGIISREDAGRQLIDLKNS